MGLLWPLRQSTASQEIPLGPFVDSTDGNTQETALTIANTDIKLLKAGATSEVSKNSGGATHIANGRYYAVLDATDSDTVGPMRVSVHVAGALAVWLDCMVFEEAIYDALFASGATGLLPANVTQWKGSAPADLTDTDKVQVSLQHNNASIGNWNVGKTGYALTANTGLGNQTADITGNLSGSVGSVTAGVSLADDAITAAKFDESTAFPLKSADTGSTQVARTGADGDTLETLSDQADLQATAANQTIVLESVQYIRKGTAQAGASGSITLDSGASSVTNFYQFRTIYILSGTGAGQVRFITAYNATSKVATVHRAWSTTPDNTSVFVVQSFPLEVELGTVGGVTPVQAFANSGILAPSLGPAEAGSQQAKLDTITTQTEDSAIEAAAAAALEAIHLDHLLAADYDPSSKPGNSTALLNELVESDSGVSRFTQNALEQGPGGGNVTVGDLTQAALAKFVTQDTGQTSAAAGSVAKIAQGAAGGSVTVSALEAAALAQLVGSRITLQQQVFIRGRQLRIVQGDDGDADHDTHIVFQWDNPPDFGGSDSVVFKGVGRSTGDTFSWAASFEEISATQTNINVEWTAAQSTALEVDTYDCRIVVTFADGDTYTPVIGVEGDDELILPLKVVA